MKTNISISLDKDVIEQLKQLATKRHQSFSALLQQIIYQFLEEEN